MKQGYTGIERKFMGLGRNKKIDVLIEALNDATNKIDERKWKHIERGLKKHSDD